MIYIYILLFTLLTCGAGESFVATCDLNFYFYIMWTSYVLKQVLENKYIILHIIPIYIIV